MISRSEVDTAVRVISQFVEECGDSPMGGQSLVSREWDRARKWIEFENDCSPRGSGNVSP